MNIWRRIAGIMVLGALSAQTPSAYATVPTGWLVAGSAPKNYEFGTAAVESRAGGKAAYIRATASGAPGFGTLMQNVSAERYAGLRVRLSARMRTDDAGRGQMWMRIDGADQKVLGFDNMDARPLTGTNEWRRYEIVLEVPASAKGVAFGFLLSGKGTIWADDFALEVVDAGVPLTATAPFAAPVSPANTDFES